LKLDNLDLSLTSLRDALRGANNKTLTDLDTDLSNIYSRLDVALSTRASETTLSGIKTQTDKLTFDASNYLQVNVKAIVNPSNLDVALSTRASESTLSGLSGKFPSAATLADNLGNPTTTIIGSALLGWDGTYWRRLSTDTSSRLRTVVESVANPSNLDVALSTRASESTLSGIKTQTDKLTFDTSNYLQVNVKAIVNPSNLDVALSTRASETTLSELSGKFPSAVSLADNLSNPTTTIIGVANLGWDGTYWRRIATDTSSRLRTVVESVANPSNLDVALSTRASESTLSGLSGKFPSAAALGDALANPTTTIIGGALLGFDGTNWGRVAVRALDIIGATGRALAVVNFLTPSRMPYMVDDISVSTTEASTAISAPGAKILKITNKGDVDCLIGINASVPATNPMKVRSRTAKIFLFGGATAVYYKTASGSTTISIEWFN
jgi:hypothetical protein